MSAGHQVSIFLGADVDVGVVHITGVFVQEHLRALGAIPDACFLPEADPESVLQGGVRLPGLLREA